ncbi:hypothetical protein CDD80_7257 [Ophiocordyceps camponoti-rufipedis]|uniref:Major facilitator superfamily (MFS) profile domain-containing protein n=1 Tax=Ophiocordyceps camponoti-rufipedis TaxID=2004952 RepID=A0A2C5ZEM6_9HYPO|nr:hypothetical protein CDD80_7257 [Ophiocordyceps camponoti-rufipedis]
MTATTAKVDLPLPKSLGPDPWEDGTLEWETNGGLPDLNKLDTTTTISEDDSPFAKLRMMEESLWYSQKMGNSDPASEERSRGPSDKSLTFLQCCRKYPKALAWSGVLLTTMIAMSYSKSLIPAIISTPKFEREFGVPRNADDPSAGLIIEPVWQIALQDASLATEIVGLMLCGPLTEVVGYRKMMIGSLIWTCIGFFPAVFFENLPTLLGSQIMLGISWGVIEILAFLYAAELVPHRLRAFVISSANMCWLIGRLLSAGFVAGFGDRSKDSSTARLPFVFQWVCAVPALLAVSYVPESPWWLVRRGRLKDACLSLDRLSSRMNTDPDAAVALMNHTNKIEMKLKYGGARAIDMFKGTNRRRTEIACMVWICQAFSGSSIISYAPYLMQRAGLEASASGTYATVMYGIAVAGGILSLFVVQYVGRRLLYLLGLGSAVIFLLVAGIVSIALPPSYAVGWTLTALIIVTKLTSDLSIDPVRYILVTEIPAMRLRLNTVAFGRILYNICKIANNVIMPHMINPEVWDWKGKVCFVYAGTSLAGFIWCYFRLPETKGLAHIEIDILFELKAPAKKFAVFRKQLEKTPYSSSVDHDKNPWHGWLSYA